MSEQGVQVIERALSIIELLAHEKEGLGITEISNKLKLNKSTVHRIAATLTKHGYLQKTPLSSYKIGMRFIQISSGYLSNLELTTEAKPFLTELAHKVRLPVHLGILDSLEIIYIDKVDVINSIRLYSQIGRRTSIHSSSLGKIILSELSDAELKNLLSNYEFKASTENTITDIDKFIEEIKNARKKGYAIDNCENDENIRCIAAPVYDYRKKIIAALSITGSTEALPKENDDIISSLAVETAYKISKKLGYYK